MSTVYTPLGHFINVSGIGQCIVDRLADTEAGVPNRVCIYPGDVAWDQCQCGMLALTTSRIFGSQTFPNEGLQAVALSNCGLPFMVANVDVTMLRCVPGVRSPGHPPECEDLANATRTMYEDAFAVWQGVLCCLRAMKNANMIAEYNMAAQTFVGPQGQCAGSTMSINIGYLAACC